MACESIVAAVVGRYGHNGAGSVPGEHVIAHPYRNFFAGKRIDGVGAGEHTAHLLVNHSLALRLVLYAVDVDLYLLAAFRSGDFLHIFAFGSEHHECDAKHRIGACGENFKFYVGTVDGETHLRSLRPSYPVALGLFQGIGPVNGIKAVEQTLGVGRHAQTPLIHELLLHRITAADRHSLAHLVVGKHGAELRTPVYHRVAQIGYAVVHQSVALLLFVHGFPLIGREVQFLAAGSIDALASFFFKMLHKVGNGHRAVETAVVVAFKHLYERPLCPAVKFRIAGAYTAVPVVAETDFVELLAIACNIFLSGNLGVLTGLDGILFGGKSVGVESHRMQHIESLQAFVARIDVGGYVAQRVSYMQSGSRGVGKHVENIVFRSGLVNFCGVHIVFFPVVLPALLYIFMIVFHILIYNVGFTCFLTSRAFSLSGVLPCL